MSSTLVEPSWNNTTVLAGDSIEAVTRLKREIDGEVVIPASHRLGRSLMEHGLVDEIRLVMFPVVLGAGERFFGPADRATPLHLAGTQAIGEGLILLTYRFTQA